MLPLQRLAMAATALAIGACAGDTPSVSTAQPGPAYSVHLTAGPALPNAGPDAAEFPLQRTLRTVVTETSGLRRDDVRLVLGPSLPLDSLKVTTPPSAVLPARGTLTLDSVIVYRESLRGTTVDFAYALALSPATAERGGHVLIEL